MVLIAVMCGEIIESPLRANFSVRRPPGVVKGPGIPAGDEDPTGAPEALTLLQVRVSSANAVVGASILVVRLWVAIGILGVLKRLWDKWGSDRSSPMVSH